jgi:hypothetical protein
VGVEVDLEVEMGVDSDLEELVMVDALKMALSEGRPP